MNKTTIKIPKGIRYISEWTEFKLPEVPTIINKQICGCGFTEMCLSNSDNVILVSPRRVLLENKANQHKEDPRLLYVRNEGEKVIGFEKDLNKATKEVDLSEEVESLEHIQELKQSVIDHYLKISPVVGCKFSVTYDSFRHVREALGERIKSFYIVIDEMQSVFIDAKFKPTTGIELLSQLEGLTKVCFVSATPMLDKYLEMLEEFKDLDYIGLDWAAEDPGRVTKPQLEAIQCSSIITESSKIINSYLNGQFEVYSYREKESGRIEEIVSNEAVLYVNSVKTICEIIKRNNLLVTNTNVICAKTPDNLKRIRQAFNYVVNSLVEEINDKLKNSNLSKSETEELINRRTQIKTDNYVSAKDDILSKVPTKGELHKMFTLCTRTVYLGADFYSTCARTFIFSDANIDSLSVDVSMDLPQILGRQRLNENPWKNRATLFFKPLNGKKEVTIEDFNNRILKKKGATDSLLRSFEKTDSADKQILAEKYLRDVMYNNYNGDYVSINKHAGGVLVPEFNTLVLVSELRCYEVQQVDYKNRITLFSAIEVGESSKVVKSRVDELLDKFNSLSFFIDKMKFLCDLSTTNELRELLERVPIIFKNYYNTVGLEKCRALKYQQLNIKKEYDTLLVKQEKSFLTRIYSTFEVGKRYSKSYIKEELGKIYKEFEREITPKATDLIEWFSVLDCKVSSSGVRSSGFEILKRI